MSNKTQLSTNNTQLASLIQTLQGKAAGGGAGGSVETCTVILDVQNAMLHGYTSTIYTDGNIQSNNVNLGNNGIYEEQVTIENVICNSGLSLIAAGWNGSLAITIDGNATLDYKSDYSNVTFTIGEAAGTTVTITVWDDD